MKLESNSFALGGNIPREYTCQGKNVNPHLRWSDAPAGTKSFALILDDPDAKRVAGFTWIHWLVKDIDAGTREVKEDSIPGVEVVNSFRKKEYGGPCPPDGEHRYYFRLFALNVPVLNAIDAKSFYAQVELHKLEESILMGKYTKS